MDKYRYIRLFSIKNVPIHAHWSLLALFLITLVSGFKNSFFLIGAISFILLMLAHELGHMWFASRKGLKTYEIRLHILHGTCEYELGETEYENYMVAWGGVAAQAIIFIPSFILYFAASDFLPSYIVTLLVFLSFYNLLSAAFNLIPVQPLDGASCWKSIPLYLKYGNKSNKKKKNHLKVIK